MDTTPRQFAAILTYDEESEEDCMALTDEQEATRVFYRGEPEMLERFYRDIAFQVVQRKLYFELSGDTKVACKDCEGTGYRPTDKGTREICPNKACVDFVGRYFDWWGNHVLSDIATITFVDLRDSDHE